MLKCRLDEFLRGQFRDTEGKIVRIDYSKIRIFVDSATTTKADGKEAQIPMHPSNLMLVKLELDDERKAILERKTVDFAESE